MPKSGSAPVRTREIYGLNNGKLDHLSPLSTVRRRSDPAEHCLIQSATHTFAYHQQQQQLATPSSSVLFMVQAMNNEQSSESPPIHFNQSAIQSTGTG